MRGKKEFPHILEGWSVLPSIVIEWKWGRYGAHYQDKITGPDLFNALYYRSGNINVPMLQWIRAHLNNKVVIRFYEKNKEVDRQEISYGDLLDMEYNLCYRR